MAPMGKGRGEGVARPGAKSGLGLFLLEVYDTQSSGQQLRQDRPSPSLKPPGETGVQFPLTSEQYSFPRQGPHSSW